MSIVESRSTSGRSKKVASLASIAVLSTAAFVAAPRAAHGSAAWIGTGDLSWFNTANWSSGTSTGFLPESNVALTAGVLNINANNATLPATGVLFDPANQASNSSYVAKIETAGNLGTFYVTNSNTSATETAAPNSLTVNSGTLEAWAWTIGRDGSALLTQNGGAIISDGKFIISGANSAAGDGSFVQGSGTYAYHGGSLVVKNQVQLAGGNNVNATTTNQGVGKWAIYNDGADGAIQIANSLKIAANSSGTGTLGIVEFHYDLNTHGTGNVRPVQDNVNTTNSQLTISNSTNQMSELSLVLDTAPSVFSGFAQNLGLFKENTITGVSTFAKTFFATDGITNYTQGATISAVVGGTTYSWTISYSGVITFSTTANSAYTTTSIAATGGNDVVLVGLPVPEPSTIALLGGAGSLILARRRRKA